MSPFEHVVLSKKMVLAVASILFVPVIHAAALSTAIRSEETRQIKAVNAGLDFVEYGQKRYINTKFSAVTLFEGPESPGKPSPHYA